MVLDESFIEFDESVVLSQSTVFYSVMKSEDCIFEERLSTVMVRTAMFCQSHSHETNSSEPTKTFRHPCRPLDLFSQFP